MNDHIEAYANASIEASKRVRKLVLLLVFSSILSFISFWNTREDGWNLQRYNRITSAYGLVYNKDSKLPPLTKQDSSLALKFIFDQSINTQEEFEDLRKIYVEKKRDLYTVKMPILGASFDINDLGLFSGITYTTMLLILLFCLERERHNIIVTLSKAEEANLLDYYYEFLSMQQVLTIPNSGIGKIRYWLKWATQLLYFLPVTIAIIIYLNDIQTSDLGNIINEKSTLTSNLSSSIFTTLVALLTFLCTLSNWQTNKVWKHFFKKLGPASENKI